MFANKIKISKISIIIPNWNGRHFLEICLKSLLNQTYSNYEIIVVDNGSKDDSLLYIKDNYPKVKIVKLNRNFGFSTAVNIGIKEAEGDYIFLLNNDTELDKHCLQILCDVLNDRPEISFCATKMLFFDNRNIINNTGDIFSIYGIAHQRGKGEIDNGQYNQRELIFGACAGAAIYRKELFQKVGLFDEDFFVYLEDIDFSFRAQLAGFKCLYVPEAIVYHVDGGTSKKINNLSRYFTLRNSLYIIIKNLPLLLILKYSPFIFIGQIRNIFVGIKHKCFKLVIEIYLDFIKHFLHLLSKRAKIFKGRKVSNQYLNNIIFKKYPFSIKKSLSNML